MIQAELEFSNELSRQLSEALGWLKVDDELGTKKIVDFLNNSPDKELWWNLFAHFKLVVEEGMDEDDEPISLPSGFRGDC